MANTTGRCCPNWMSRPALCWSSRRRRGRTHRRPKQQSASQYPMILGHGGAGNTRSAAYSHSIPGDAISHAARLRHRRGGQRVCPLSALVGQSPGSRTKGHSRPLLQDAVAGAGWVGASAGAGAVVCLITAGIAAGGVAVGALVCTGAGLAAPADFSTGVGQSPLSRTNGHNQLLPQDVVAVTACGAAAGVGAGLACVTRTGAAGAAACAGAVARPVTGLGVPDLSASVAQSPESRTKGHSSPLLHCADAGVAAVTCGCATVCAACGGICVAGWLLAAAGRGAGAEFVGLVVARGVHSSLRNGQI